MDYSNKLQQDAEELKAFCNDHSKKYPEDDIRADFFGMLYDLLDNYYKGYLTTELAGNFQNKNLVINPEFSKTNAQHLKSFIEISTIKAFNTSFISNLNRRFIIDTWSIFELSINLVAGAVLDKPTIDSLLDFETREILEILKKEKIEPVASLGKLKKRFNRDGLTHVPITRKVHKILDLIKDCYKRDPKADEEFLIFYGKYRNTMHFNFIYYGKDYDYTFKGNLFKFRDGKIVTYQNNFNPSTDLYVSLFNEVKDIFYNIIGCINPENPIPYPDTGIYWEQ